MEHSNAADSYGRYWESQGRDLSVEQLKTSCLMILGLQVLFSWLDWVAFPDSFALFVTVRMSVNVLLLACLLNLRFQYPRFCQIAIALALGAEILLMIYETGGPVSDYYAGLIILCVGMPVMLPYTRREALGISSAFLVAFAASPVVVPGEFQATQFLISLVFVASGCIECVVSSGLLTTARIADFQQRAELERARDRLAALDEAKARFSANVHHELRTPLTLILAPLDALRSGQFGAVSEAVERTLRTMHINGQRLLKMINNLLDLAKVESQSFEIHRRPMDVEKLLRDVVDGAEGLAARKGIALVLEAPADGSIPRLNADADALEKVVMNLVGNALKFTEQGGRITVSVAGGVAVDGYDGVEVAVADTGIGLPVDKLETVFDRFSQVDSSATRKHEGTGIGLSLARELVELHGGRIWAESEGEGCGTSMRFQLPVGEIDADAPEEVLYQDEGDDGHDAKLTTSVQAVEADLGLPVERGERARMAEMELGIRHWQSERAAGEGAAGDAPLRAAAPDDAPEVLVVEDNPDMRDLLVFLLGHEFRIRSAANGREALDRVAESHPDLVLTDVMMPGMSGTELCDALKRDPATREIPVVLVTSKAEREMKVKGLELGADDYVTKPFHPRELLARVRALVTHNVLRRELAARNAELEVALAELEQAQVKLVQSERLAAVGELAAGIAHEVNNPVNFALNAVRAMRASLLELRELGEAVAALDFGDEAGLSAQLGKLRDLAERLEVGDLTDTVGELSGIVAEGLTRTHSLVADLRDFAAPGRGGNRGAVDVAKGLASTVQLLKHLLRDANATLTLEVEEGLPTIEGDAGALNQVFLNLVKNAAEALTGEGGSIVVTAAARGGELRVAVADDGPGIPEGARERLFEPFFSTKPEGRGTGLGLSICKQIAEAHGGALEVGSAAGRGTVMTLVLPLRDGDAVARTDRAANDPAPEAGLDG